jgi:hypothetical protein
MSSGKSKTTKSDRSKNLEIENKEHETPSIIDSDLDPESDGNQASARYDVNHQIRSVQSIALSNLLTFFANPKYIKPSHDPETNIVDRYAGKCYHIPERKISYMFGLLEAARRSKEKIMFCEKQLESSGIMLDFDIYQDSEDNQLTDEIFNVLCQNIIKTLLKILKFKEKKEKIVMGITRRPKITYNEEKECWKDGFHLLIPGIKVTRSVKRFIIRKLLEDEIIDQTFQEVQPATFKLKGQDYQRKDFIDQNSAHVMTFFIGSNTKKGNSPYKLSHIYEASINTETKAVVVQYKPTWLTDTTVNICYEFSLNYQVQDASVRQITKLDYEVQDKYLDDIQQIENKHAILDEERNRNYGSLSTNAIHDHQIVEIKELLDTLSPKRSIDYQDWFNVLCVLANTSISYRDLAEYFSRKSAKFNMADFDQVWTSITKRKAKNALTIGSLHHWAKIDNPDRYAQIRKQNINSILYKMVYEGYREGILMHSDIAKILYQILQHKYVTDIPEGEKKIVWYEFILDDDTHIDGELYKWRKYKDLPTSLSNYISDVLPELFHQVLKNVKDNYEKSSGDLSKYFHTVLRNFKASMRKLGDRHFKISVIKEAEDRFNKYGFATKLDIDPLCRGVQNGVLKLNVAPGGKPRLIQGYHSHMISKFTNVPYIPFDPYDPLTKEIIITLRNIFPDNEPDTHEFTMCYLASTIDGNPKESMFMIMVGRGANGKSFIAELHKAAIGPIYGVKLPLSFLTAKSNSAEGATPAQMLLQHATLATYSESNHMEVLNTARIKEMTGLENLCGRRLHQDMVNFKPRCHHLVTTNHDFVIEHADFGLWRRIVYNPLKITFVDINKYKLDASDPLQRIADPKLTQQWTDDPEVQGRYLGYMVWFHHWLHRKYNGIVGAIRRPHVDFETEKYKIRQDVISSFIAQKFVEVEDPTQEFPIADEIQKYIRWYSANHGGLLPIKGITEQFMNSVIGKFIILTSRGYFLKGHRFLDNNEQPTANEKYVMKHVFELVTPSDNFGIKPETPLEYYERVCKEYDAHKHIFDNKDIASIEVDPHTIKTSEELLRESKTSISGLTKETLSSLNQQRTDNISLDNISNSCLRILEEPSMNMLTDTYGDELQVMSILLHNEDDMVIIDEVTPQAE